MFKGRKLCIASMHKKEKVLKPLLEKELGVICKVAENLNTDFLGTFSGEVERIISPLDAARQKCVLAMELSNCDLAVSSEGSFGPHPIYGFIPCDDELLFFTIKKIIWKSLLASLVHRPIMPMMNFKIMIKPLSLPAPFYFQVMA
jgi:hypothetical protein